MAAGLAATIVAVPIAQAAPGGNGNGSGTPPEHAGPPADTGPPATPPGQADPPAPASPPSSAGGNPNPGTPPTNSNAGGTAGGNPNPGTPPDHSNAGGSAGGNPAPGTPPDHSNAGGNGGGNPTPGTPPDHSNAGGNGNGNGGGDGNGPPDHSNAGGQDKVTICHATGSATNPYVTITVAEPSLTAHAAHGDLIPAPAGGCPGDETGPGGGGGEPNSPAPGNGQEKVGICHATGSATNPYVVIVVAAPAVPAHVAHGDITPIPAGGCPGTTPTAADDTAPVGDTSTPAAPDGGQEKVEICHQTGSDSNPYVVISVAASALPAHLAHGDITPVPEGGCPGENTIAVGSGGEELVRLCHATGDDADPYEILTVPASEVPGHIDHGDVIGEECPGSGVLAATGTGTGDPGEEDDDAVLAAAGAGDPGATAFDDTGAAGDEGSGTLPFTGLDLLAMAIVGGILLLTGWQLRRMRGGAASG